MALMAECNSLSIVVYGGWIEYNSWNELAIILIKYTTKFKFKVKKKNASNQNNLK